MTIKGEATVVKHTGSHYMLAQLPQWNLFPAVLRGKIRLKGSTATNPVAVGDRVTFEADIPDEAFTNEGQVLAEDGRKVSLDTQITDDLSMSLGDILAAEEGSPKEIDADWQKAVLQSAVEHVLTRTALSPRDRDIYRDYVQKVQTF